MEQKKQWNDGGSLTATYEGSGDGTAVFSSDTYEGIDREMSVVFRDAGKSIAVERTVRQEGIRQPIRLSGGGIFRLANGGRFGVLKEGGVEPPAPTETYTKLTHVECNGQQYIDLGYIVKEDDVIEANFVLTKIDSTDKFLFGTNDGNVGLWFEYYNNAAYARFGHTSSYSLSNSSEEYKVVLKKDNIVIGGTSASLSYTSMPKSSLFLFAGVSTSGNPYAYGYYRCSLFRITDSNGVVMELIPHRRDSDGVAGLLDTVSGTFYVSAGESLMAGGVVMGMS